MSSPIFNVISNPIKLASIGARFWPYVDRSGGPDSCWPWTGGKSKQGYGKFRISREFVAIAPRVAFALAEMMDPDDLHVCHHCDNPPCCNPKHLFVGDNDENHADAAAKGRMKRGTSSPGQSNPGARLSEDDVIRIISAMITQGLNNKQLADIFGVSHATISVIRRGKTWGLLMDRMEVPLGLPAFRPYASLHS